jgi:hypothetical protein
MRDALAALPVRAFLARVSVVSCRWPWLPVFDSLANPVAANYQCLTSML